MDFALREMESFKLEWMNEAFKRLLATEKAMAPHSSILAWQIPWMEDPGRLQSMGSLGVWHNWATSLSLFTFMHWTRKWQPTPVFLPGESQGRGAWCTALYGVAQSRTRLKRLSSSSSSKSIFWFSLFFLLWPIGYFSICYLIFTYLWVIQTSSCYDFLFHIIVVREYSLYGINF